MHSSNGKYNTKKKVLHIFGILNRGGAENRTLEFITRNKGTDVMYDMLVLSGAKGVLDNEFAEVIGGRIHYIKLDRSFFFKFIKLLRSQKYDVVHSHVLMVSALFLKIAWLLGVPVRIAHLRSTGSGSVPFSRKFRDFFLRQMMLMFATNIIAVSESVARAIWGRNWSRHKKLKVIYNGFVLNRNNAVSYNRIIKIGHIGRFHESKNHLFLADVFKDICDSNDNVVCSMTGRLDNAIYPSVVQKLKKYIDTGKIIIQGDNANVYDMMRNLDIMITTSLWEGLPGIIIEAVSSGVPVLASGIEPNKEVASKLRGVRIVEGWNRDEWKQALVSLIDELKVADKKLMIEDVQEAFLASPFYYENTDRQLLSVYKVKPAKTLVESE
jgi:glycosyltransferase involved in cell wall biosynthesis